MWCYLTIKFSTQTDSNLRHTDETLHKSNWQCQQGNVHPTMQIQLKKQKNETDNETDELMNK